jgi:hypothetical protein
MQDLQAELERLRIEAEDCDKIGKLTTDLQKRDLFKRLAYELREMARQVEIVIASRKPDSA